MEPFQQRVIEERDELRGRLDRLNAFMADETRFTNVDAAEQDRMRRQQDAMMTYLSVLEERISAFA